MATHCAVSFCSLDRPLSAAGWSDQSALASALQQQPLNGPDSSGFTAVPNCSAQTIPRVSLKPGRPSRACCRHGMQRRSLKPHRPAPLLHCCAPRTRARMRSQKQAAHAQHTHAQDTHTRTRAPARAGMRARPRHTGRHARLCSGGRARGRVHRSGHAAVAHERVRLAGRVVASGTPRPLRPLRFRFIAAALRGRGGCAEPPLSRIGMCLAWPTLQRKLRRATTSPFRSEPVRPALSP